MAGRSLVYLAAPLFNVAERSFNVQVRNVLAPYFDVFLPQEDGELMIDLIAEGMPVDQAKLAVFAKDYEAIQQSNILLIILDGRSVDEGAAFELGAAFALGKECWSLKTDMRQLLKVGDNPMIEVAIKERFYDLAALVEHSKRYRPEMRVDRRDSPFEHGR